MTTVNEPTVMSPDANDTSVSRIAVGNLPWIAMGLLILGGIAAGVAIEQTAKVDGFFQVPPEFKRSHVPPSEEMLPKVEAAELATKYKNAAWVFGLAGMILGGAGGAAAGVWRKSGGQIASGTVVGVLLGGVSGGLGGYLAMLVFQTIGFVDDESMAYRAMAVHATGWGLVGLGVSLAAALPLRRFLPVVPMIGGVIGAAMIAAVIYAPAAAVLFPLEDSTGQLAPTGGANRILWTTLTSTLMGLAMSATLSPPKTKPTVKSEEETSA